MNEHYFAEFGNRSQFQSLLSRENKFLYYMVCLGKGYHQGNELWATIDLYANIIASQVQLLEENTALDAQKQKIIQGDFYFTVIIGDSLMAHNSERLKAFAIKPGEIPSDEYFRILDEVRREKSEQGLAWVAHHKPLIESRLQSAAKGKIKVYVSCENWHIMVSRAYAQHHFQAYFDHLMALYLHTMSDVDSLNNSFFGTVNYKGHAYLNRAARKDLNTDRSLWYSTPIHYSNLHYILEEMTFIHCMRNGMLVPQAFIEAHKQADLNRRPILFLVHPAREVSAFKMGGRSLKQQKDRLSNKDYPLEWMFVNIGKVNDLPLHHDNLCHFYGLSQEISAKDKDHLRVEAKKTLGFHSRIPRKTGFLRDANCDKCIVTNAPEQYPFYIRQERYYKDLEEAETQIVVLTALGGMGKTQLTRDFFESSDCQHKIWFSVQNHTYLKSFNMQYLSLFDALGLKCETSSQEEIILKIRDYFENHHNWLMVLDDVYYLEPLMPYLPRTGGRIIISTRGLEDLNGLKATIIRLSGLEHNQAIALFENITNRRDEEVPKLCQKLSNYPLAIVHVASYLQHCPNETANDYLTYLTRLSTQVYEETSAPNQNTVARTLRMSLSVIQPEAYEILLVCAHLYDSPVSRDHIKAWYLSKNVPKDEACFDELMDHLSDFHLISLSSLKKMDVRKVSNRVSVPDEAIIDIIIDIHPLVKEFLLEFKLDRFSGVYKNVYRKRFDGENEVIDKVEWLAEIGKPLPELLATKINSRAEYSYVAALPNLQHLIDQFPASGQSQTWEIVLCRLLHLAGIILFRLLKDSKSAYPYLKKSYSLALQLYPDKTNIEFISIRSDFFSCRINVEYYEDLLSMDPLDSTMSNMSHCAAAGIANSCSREPIFRNYLLNLVTQQQELPLYDTTLFLLASMILYLPNSHTQSIISLCDTIMGWIGNKSVHQRNHLAIRTLGNAAAHICGDGRENKRIAYFHFIVELMSESDRNASFQLISRPELFGLNFFERKYECGISRLKECMKKLTKYQGKKTPLTLFYQHAPKMEKKLLEKLNPIWEKQHPSLMDALSAVLREVYYLPKLFSDQLSKQQLCLLDYISKNYQKDPAFFYEVITLINTINSSLHITHDKPEVKLSLSLLGQILMLLNRHDKRTNYPLTASQTALHHAIICEDSKQVAALLKSNARYDLPNAHGQTAIDLAIKTTNPEILEIFKQAIMKKYRKYGIHDNGDLPRLVRTVTLVEDICALRLLIHLNISVNEPSLKQRNRHYILRLTNVVFLQLNY